MQQGKMKICTYRNKLKIPKERQKPDKRKKVGICRVPTRSTDPNVK